ncbi:ADP-ribosyl-(dinitrogen reductase) glycohydrolase [Sporotomaculum syntrophicum]|uniref:ADP-ribosyl-(Dinitrogen reductase) glycohydrolase n=1 Tax=Sporotomaculum syntrophicum TaxID=182264 RepID=A0A9D3AX82_9FIRM|nr:ADP-ribosylglycohydrolase family protein [Sporotomaculum syntrophicum]KAF1084747.1 ADP-ribosyl-(dinitrogen reductase) glycohydrolase [Sporotomaculum syntrophicum]
MKREQIIGGILGVITGDALGLPVQFLSRQDVQKNPIKEMTGYGTFNTPPGTWSDDSSLTLCLVETLSSQGYDLTAIGQNFVRWFAAGHWTPFGRAFDIGGATWEAMENLSSGVEPLLAGPAGERNNGNGSLMRILPAAIYFAGEEDSELVQKICAISRITHGHPRSQLACCLYALLVKELLNGKSPVAAYAALQQKAATIFPGKALAGELPHFERVLAGTLPVEPEERIKSSGYVVDTLEAAIWCLLNESSFAATLLTAVNLGEDTDTVGAVTGGLAGVYYGLTCIPDVWLKAIIHIDEIKSLCAQFVSSIKRVH